MMMWELLLKRFPMSRVFLESRRRIGIVSPRRNFKNQNRFRSFAHLFTSIQPFQRLPRLLHHRICNVLQVAATGHHRRVLPLPAAALRVRQVDVPL